METRIDRTHIQWLAFGATGCLTILIFSLYLGNFVRWRNSPDFGWRAMYNSGPNIVAEVMETGKKAGLEPGDRIEAVNGHAYHSFNELFFKIRNTEPGTENIYTIIRDGKSRQVKVVTGRLGFKSVLARSGPVLFIGMMYIFIGGVVFLMKPKAYESRQFFIMSCIVGLGIGFSAPSDLMKPLWLFKIRLLYDVFFPAPIIHIAFWFPKKRSFISGKPWLWIVPYLISLIIFTFYMAGFEAYWDTRPVLDLINEAYLMAAILIFFISTIWNRFKDPSVMVKTQSQVILLGIFLGFFIPVCDLLFRNLWGVYVFSNPGIGFAIFLPFFPLSIGYTIVRHDLFEFDVIIKRTYGYILTTGAVAGTYGVFVLISNVIFGKFKITNSPLFPLAFILAVLFFFNPIRNRVQKVIDRLFYRLEYNYQETVQKISEKMRSLLKLDEIGDYIIDTLVNSLFIESGAILLLNDNKNAYEFLSGENYVSNDSNHLLNAEDPIFKKILDRKREITIFDIQKDPFFEDVRESCINLFNRIGALLMVPLIYENQLTGLITLGNKKSGKFFRREDINLISTLANQGAVAIENACMIKEVIEKERMEEELSIGRDLQMSMLPSECPVIEGFEMEAYSISAMEVGGDFYDFIKTGENKISIIIGDVTGKSVSGALVMSASRSIFRMLIEEELSVGEVMGRANRRTKKDIKSGMFVALLFAVLDAEEKRLRLCSAGQTQPVYICADSGRATLVDTVGDNFPLGILDEADYQETSLALSPGDKIIFYTDGIVEAMNDKEEMFGFERLLEIAQKAGPMTAKQLMKEIIENVSQFAGEMAQHDDITIIVLGVKSN